MTTSTSEVAVQVPVEPALAPVSDLDLSLPRSSTASFAALLAGLDAMALLAACASAAAIRAADGMAPQRRAVALFAALVLLMAVFGGRYAPPSLAGGRRGRLTSLLRAVAPAWLIAAAAAPHLLQSAWQPVGLRSGALASVLVVSLLAASHLVATAAYRRRRGAPRVLLLGSGRVASSVSARLDRHGIRVVSQVNQEATAMVAGQDPDWLTDICRAQGVEHVVVAFSKTPSHQLLDSLRRLPRHVSVAIVPRFYEMVTWRSWVDDVDGLPLLSIPSPTLSPSARVVKRVTDVLGAGVLVLLTWPLWVAAAVAIKLDSPGPVFFRQQRTGRGNRPFAIYKFRTMTPDAEQRRGQLAAANEVDGPNFKMRADPRITRVGRLLRRTSIDELPQLLNVLRGEMSLVGPRPFPVQEADNIQDWSVPRTLVKPGITGLWQVCGRNELSYDDLRHLDMAYVSSWSLAWDARILLATPGSVFRRSGAY